MPLSHHTSLGDLPPDHRFLASRGAVVGRAPSLLCIRRMVGMNPRSHTKARAKQVASEGLRVTPRNARFLLRERSEPSKLTLTLTLTLVKLYELNFPGEYPPPLPGLTSLGPSYVTYRANQLIDDKGYYRYLSKLAHRLIIARRNHHLHRKSRIVHLASLGIPIPLFVSCVV